MKESYLTECLHFIETTLKSLRKHSGVVDLHLKEKRKDL